MMVMNNAVSRTYFDGVRFTSSTEMSGNAPPATAIRLPHIVEHLIAGLLSVGLAMQGCYLPATVQFVPL